MFLTSYFGFLLFERERERENEIVLVGKWGEPGRNWGRRKYIIKYSV